jgi:hypothetical protein
MHGLLNGREVLDTPRGDLRVAHVAEDGRSATLELARDGVVVWDATVDGVGSDPLSLAADVAHLDLRTAVWAAGDAVVIAGGDRALVVDVRDGRVRRELGLVFIDKESLDVLELVAVPGAPLFVVVSTRRVWILGYPAIDDVLRYESEGPITRFESWDAGVLRVSEYDVLDPGLPIVERVVDFRS